MFIIIDISSKNVNVLDNFLDKFFHEKICKKLKLIVLNNTIQKVKTK